MRLRLWRQEVALRHPVTAAGERHTSRSHLFLALEAGGLCGVGEVSPQPQALNGDPSLAEVIVELEDFALPQLVDLIRREGQLPAWARVTHLAGSRSASRVASALVEMAVLDWWLRSTGGSLAELWPARYSTPTQVTVSMLDEGPWADVTSASQVRAKVSAAAVSSSRWDELASLKLPVLLDFNCSAGEPEEVVALLDFARRHVEVVALEQPFAPGNVIEHARLQERVDVPLSLDEGVRQRRDLDQIARYRAAQWVCVKPSRVGGFAQARTLIELARDRGLEAYVGGFFETPLARGANRALAQHLVARPSDVAPVELVDGRLLEEDRGGLGWSIGEVLAATAPLVSRTW